MHTSIFMSCCCGKFTLVAINTEPKHLNRRLRKSQQRYLLMSEITSSRWSGSSFFANSSSSDKVVSSSYQQDNNIMKISEAQEHNVQKKLMDHSSFTVSVNFHPDRMMWTTGLRNYTWNKKIMRKQDECGDATFPSSTAT